MAIINKSSNNKFWEKCGEKGTLLHRWRECKLVQPLAWFFRKLNIELPCDPAMPLMGIYLDKTSTQKDSCTPMFTAALFTIADTWKQLKCPSRWMDKDNVVHIHNRILLSHKKEQNNAICSNMDATRNYHTKWSQKEKDKHNIFHSYVEYKIWHK